MARSQKVDVEVRNRSLLEKVNDRRPLTASGPDPVHMDKEISIDKVNISKPSSSPGKITTSINACCSCGIQEIDCSEGDDCSGAEFEVKLARKEETSLLGLGIITSKQWKTVKESSELTPNSLEAGGCSSQSPQESFTVDKAGTYKVGWASFSSVAETEEFTIK